MPASLLARLPDRNIHHLLTFARRDCPVLYRREDKTWWLEGLEPLSGQELSKGDRLSNEATEVPRRRGRGMAKNIRKSSSGDPLPNPDAGGGRV
jgi:hypothetical protein